MNRVRDLATSNALGWVLLVGGVSLTSGGPRWAALAAAAAVFVGREWRDSARRGQRRRRAIGLTTRSIREMQESVALKDLTREEDFFRTEQGDLNWAKKARIEKAAHLAAAFGPDGGAVLDIGCGDGILTKRLLPGRSLVAAMDISDPLLHTMRRWVGADAAAAIQGDAEALPFRDRRFDLVVSTETLEHLVDPACALEEARRVLTDTGRVLVTVPNRDRFTVNPIAVMRAIWSHYLTRTYRHRNEALYHRGTGRFFVHNAFRPRELTILARSAGLAVIQGGTFHYSMLDRFRDGHHGWIRGVEGAMARLPIINLFGRYSYAILAGRPGVDAGPDRA